MAEASSALSEAAAAMSPLEIVAVVLALAYLVLAAREHISCWVCAFFSTAIYVYLFYDVSLLSESLLNGFYLVMAVYGFYRWRWGSSEHGELSISDRPTRWHVQVVVLTGLCVPVLGWVMATQFAASMPYLDAFTTCFAVVTTWMVTQKILENWLYWFVIDSVSIYLYFEKGLILTSLLFVVYLVLIVIGYRRWSSEFRTPTVMVTG